MADGINELRELSPEELIARLVQRGVEPGIAENRVYHFLEGECEQCAHVICRELGVDDNG